MVQALKLNLFGEQNKILVGNCPPPPFSSRGYVPVQSEHLERGRRKIKTLYTEPKVQLKPATAQSLPDCLDF